MHITLEEFLQFLGLSIGQKVKLRDTVYTITVFQGAPVLMDAKYGIVCNISLSDVNKLEILEEPFKPTYGEEYFAVDFSVRGMVESYTWEDDFIDCRQLDNSVIFRTKEEAQKAAEKMLNALKE